ncbi:MAG: ATP-dependent DNA helicase RecG [Planktomarina sp.]|jgi:ATP-dependent DNA helicase RecG|nr:ATP-dependent DNA helicase RecG [Planktomarina sp.]MDG1744475.1 ATP-dependent DNA helicase RecG [Planktomarina sp.]
MSTRPESLFPLFAELSTLAGVGEKSAKAFAGLKITKPRDLIFTLPHAVVDRRVVHSVQGLPAPQTLSVRVRVVKHMPARGRGKPYRIIVEDAQTTIELIFFHSRGDYLERILPMGEERLISGKLEVFDHRAQMVHPEYILKPEEQEELPQFEPVYPLTAGVSGKLMAKAVRAAIGKLPEMPEWIEPSVLRDKGWPDFATAVHQAHSPKSADDVAAHNPARARLAYDEFLAHQLTKAIARAQARVKTGRITAGTGQLQRKVLEQLPYAPTGAQRQAIAEIGADMASPRRMNRLLQGDVGAGKTLVGFMALLQAVESGGQGVLMAPTEILARQHLEGLRPLADRAGVRVDMLTGRDKSAARRQKLEDLASGAIDILVGTHAVFQEQVTFKDLRLSIIDEQHRFGVRQRLALGAKGTKVDVLVMSATPIPRSLELAQYGDMDVSTLYEKPPGRKPITTAAVPLARLADVISKLKAAIASGRQAYWVCPLVEESETMDLTAAEERFKILRAALGDDRVGLVHGQLAPAEKDAAMAEFVSGKTQVLVATTVIEVGVDVPNATIMVIERAENFGLAQLHQLRGRVGRGDAASTCLLMYQAPLSKSAERRLAIMRDTEDGFLIAEEDLKMRGAGDVIGTAQSGLPRFKVADLEHQSALMATAHQDARMLLHSDPALTSTRGRAARLLLWLMEQDQAVHLISVG